MHQRFHTIAAGIFTALLFVPMVQQVFRWIPTQELHGAFTKTEYLPLTLKSWWDGEFQLRTDAYAAENFGCRNELIRVNNEVNYTLFHKINAAEVVEGKNGVLFEYKYIEAYTGLEKVNETDLTTRVMKLAALQAHFKREGKLFAPVLYPGKASFFPEMLPDSSQVVSTRTNYVAMVEKLDSASLDYMDCNAWFKSMKDTSYAPLFTEIGIHWSQYGACLAMDSLVRFLSGAMDTTLNNFEWESKRPPLVDAVFFPDNDMESSLNIYSSLPHSPLAYPVLKPTGQHAFKPQVAVFSDSFFFNIINLDWKPSIFSELTMYYYNRELYPWPGTKQPLPSQAEKMKALESCDIILVMATEYNVDEIGWGIIDEAYDYFILGNAVSSTVAQQ
ncbi:MAG: alginate O-acetyltransferase AlgX-related protein [Flavobacteriales bacterium]|jgi:hypothetical protein